MCIPLSICAHKPMPKTPMYTQQNPYKVTAISNGPVKWSPRCCSGPFSSAVTIWKQPFGSPFIPSNHVTHHCMRLAALELCMPRSPCDSHTNTTEHSHTANVHEKHRPDVHWTNGGAQVPAATSLQVDHSSQRGAAAGSEPKRCTLSINLPYISNMLMAVTCK